MPIKSQHHKRAWTKQRILTHIGFWIAYFIFSHLIFSPILFSWQGMVTTLIFMTIPAISAYFNLYVLIPRLLDQKKYAWYIISLPALVILTSFALGTAIYLWFQVTYPPAWDAYVSNKEAMMGSIYGGSFSIIFLTMGIFLIRRRIINDQRQKALERANIETELRFLRNQLNPHFLFNALNSIYFLIRKDPNQAEEALAGFSDLLRYQLYGANESTIALQQEVEFLKQYASLAQLRKSNDQLEVNWQLPQQLNGEQVAPLLLLPFVENAFKHVSRKDGLIDIHLSLENDRLRFMVTNTTDTGTKQQKNEHIVNGIPEGGIGLSNVRRRLELLYPGQHQFEIHEKATTYQILVEVPLGHNSDIVSNSY